MELLKEIAKDRLVIMGRDNPEVAETYSTRIIRILDGKIIGDTNPCEETALETPVQEKAKKSNFRGSSAAARSSCVSPGKER